MEAPLAREVYVDCIRRDPAESLDTVRRDVSALRPGASCIVVLADDPRTIKVVEAWAIQGGLHATLCGHPGMWALRLYMLPDHFGELPELVVVERDLHRRAA